MSDSPVVLLFFDPLAQSGPQEQKPLPLMPSAFSASKQSKRSSTTLHRSRSLELVATDLIALMEHRGDVGPPSADPA
ncbi:hypothetical protein [Paenarthrobacter sp. AMU7]|uniref:Uncharacterized protein n=1 Tax=Paenarthrobacter sp. AMU7 TaxID=3162492 RepID=A0AB39YRC1_9MICC